MVRRYEAQRFGGASGRWVNRRELALLRALLPPGGPVLDLACGTGRISRLLRARGETVVGVDASWGMAAATRAAAGAPVVLGDAFRLPFADGRFAAVVALRLTFHYADLAALLREMARVVRPGGCIVFDTCTYSPRAVAPLLAGRWGHRVWAHSDAVVMRAARALSLTGGPGPACFLISPHLYRLAPLWLARAAAAAEPWLPPRLLCRRYWRLTRPAAAAAAPPAAVAA